MSSDNSNIPAVENYLTVDRIAPVLGALHLQIIQLEGAVQTRDGIIQALREELNHREEVRS